MTEQSLIYRCGGRLHALALSHVIEIMRPLPIDASDEQAPLFRGTSIIRGETVPVFDFTQLAGAGEGAPTRLVNIRAGERRFAFLAEEVIGVHAPPETAGSLLDHIDDDALEAAVGTLDAEVRAILGAMRALPEQANT